MKKKLAVTAIVFLLIMQNIQAQGWQWIETGFPVHIFDMSFPPGQSNVGFAVGSTLPFGGDGIVLKTTNGGSAWTKISADTIPGLKAVCFTSVDVGYACGHQNFFMKTTNGGSTWSVIVVDLKLWYFNNIEFRDANNGIVVSYPSSVYRTTDAGSTWEPTFGLKHSVDDLCYADDTNLFLVGGDEKIYKSTNSGFYWGEIYGGTALKEFYGVEFFNSNYGIVCGDSGKILITSDAGVNWSLSIVSSLGLLKGIHIVSEQNSFAVGTNEQIYKTTNGGSTWISDFNGSNVVSFYKIKFTENQIGLICGSEGKFLKNTDYIIPVALIDFTASSSGNDVYLNWKTASELNNSGFEIYRLTHGTGWEKISFVSGFGNSTETNHYSFVDRELKSGNYFYQLKQIDYDGSFEFSDIINVVVLSPSEISLEQNYPNPFNPATTINFELPEAEKVILTVYNNLGQKVDELVNTTLEAGRHSYNWNASKKPSGIYFYELKTDKNVMVKNMVFIK